MLKDKSVVITGSAKGIGRYIAHTFAREGCRVTIADIDEARMQKTLGELGEIGADAQAVRTDVGDEDSVRALMAQVADRFGGIDVLVNDAAIVPHFAWGNNPRWPKVQDMDLSFFWDTVLGVALKGTFLASKHAVPYLEKAAEGHIVNLHGGGGVTPPGALAYATAKDSLVTFTKFHAEEVRDANICVVILSPGGTIATEDAPEEARGRLAGPELAGPRFTLAAQAPMEMSGHLLDLEEGDKLVVLQ
jgi:3-oxoacyl-[acyl-carrier protein] reductase